MNPLNIYDRYWQMHRIAEQLNPNLQGPAKHLGLIADSSSELRRIAEQLNPNLQGPAKYLEAIANSSSELYRMVGQPSSSLQGPAKLVEAIADSNSELRRIAERLNSNLQRPAKLVEATAYRNLALHRIVEQVGRDLLEPARRLNAIVAKEPEWQRIMGHISKQALTLPVAATDTSDDLLENMDSMRRTSSPDALISPNLSSNLSFEKSDQPENDEPLLEEVRDAITDLSATTAELRAYAVTFLSEFKKISTSNNRLAWISLWLSMVAVLIPVIGFVIEIARTDDTSRTDDLSAIKASINAVKAEISTMRNSHFDRLKQLINDSQDSSTTQSQIGDEEPESEASSSD